MIRVLLIVSLLASPALAKKYWVVRNASASPQSCANGNCLKPGIYTYVPGSTVRKVERKKVVTPYGVKRSVERSRVTTPAKLIPHAAQALAQARVNELARCDRGAYHPAGSILTGGMTAATEGAGGPEPTPTNIPTCTPCKRPKCEGCKRCPTPVGDAIACSKRGHWYRIRIWDVY